jgi:DNA adenine methylase
MNKKLRPLLKWTGGKYDEYPLFEAYIPTFERYIEPFFGGGGVFFALQPKGKSLLNDKSSDLINFYQQMDKAAFKKELLLYADAWDELTNLTHSLWESCATNFIGLVEAKRDLVKLTKSVEHNLTLHLTGDSLLKKDDFIIDFELFKTILGNSIIDKAKRIQVIVTKEKRRFTAVELFAHFETGIKSGAYLFFRKLLNLQYHQQIKLSAAKAAANWYFVREFCYAAMFRFNAKGEFNIPYGGITYNRKKFRQKITKIFTEEIRTLFKQATFSNEDFEGFLDNSNLQTDDFIFVDPPYDSEFSEYDQSAFTQKDQQRLANFLLETPAKWMVVIKETTFIRQLYSHANININTFEKNYAYNVRGRNNRGVTHLIITNF